MQPSCLRRNRTPIQQSLAVNLQSFAAKPANAGETMSLFATGFGSTRPTVDAGKPFPANPLAAVNSPVAVTVNGKPAEVLGAVGYPGSVGSYQVNFRIPADTQKGTAAIQ